MAQRMFVPAINGARGVEIIALESFRYTTICTDQICGNGIVRSTPTFQEESQIYGFAVVAHWGEPGIPATVVPLSVRQFKLLVQGLIACEHHESGFSTGFPVGDLWFGPQISDDCPWLPRGEMRIYFPHHPAHRFDLVVVRTSVLKAMIFGPRPTGPTGRIFFEALKPGRTMGVYRYGQRVAQFIVISYPFWDDVRGHWSVRAIDSHSQVAGLGFQLDLVACGIIPGFNGEWSSDSYCIVE